MRRRQFLANSGLAAASVIGGAAMVGGAVIPTQRAAQAAVTPPTYDPEQVWNRLVGGGWGVIYGIRTDGVVMWYRHMDWVNGSFSWANGGSGRPIGSGFNNFVWVGAGIDGNVFGLHGNGDLWRYRYLLTNSNTGEGYWDNGGTGRRIGTGWNRFPRVFGGPDSVIWAVDADGVLYRAQYNGGTVTPVAVGSGFKSTQYLMSDSGGVVYGVDFGSLIWFRYSGGGWINGGTPIQIGDDAWGDLTDIELISGGNGMLYLVRPDSTHVPQHDHELVWLRLTNHQTVNSGGAKWANGGNGRVVGTGFTVQHLANMQGYPDTTSVPQGGTARFAVSTSFASFKASVLRCGTAAGDLPNVWGPVDVTGKLQLLPAGYRANGCGWDNNVTVPVSSSWPSGVYALQIEGPAGMRRHIPFVVKPVAPRAPVMLLLPTNTYHAYNTWGGHSQYTPDLPAQRKLTARRPTYQAEITAPGVMRAELYSDLMLLRWMAQQGIACDVFADPDLDADPGLLSPYKAVVLGSHAEYMTASMRQTLLTYVHGGGRIINTGGNNVYEQMSYNADRSQLIFRDGAGNRTTFDSLGQPQSQVIGANYDGNTWGSYAPYKVTKDHPLLAGTGLKVGDSFGAQGYNGAASGWETDGLLGGSEEATAAQIFAVGTNDGDGGGAVMALVDRPGGGWVFTTSSITFNGALLTDPVMGKILKNVFDKAVAATLAPRTAPSVPGKVAPVQPPGAADHERSS